MDRQGNEKYVHKKPRQKCDACSEFYFEQRTESELCEEQRCHSRDWKERKYNEQWRVYFIEPLIDIEWLEDDKEKSAEYATKSYELPPGLESIE